MSSLKSIIVLFSISKSNPKIGDVTFLRIVDNKYIVSISADQDFKISLAPFANQGQFFTRTSLVSPALP